ncbi:hypothetical protein L6452_01381 [Arctium lappa]|uniref:Uncharacterized protein n=1 Tax=Arctium lappa TaxID=4217 RepID=A0ACB9FGM3_ARCLA|nr:hypothetical protein L6452_01381 [Arctium lappa]
MIDSSLSGLLYSVSRPTNPIRVRGSISRALQQMSNDTIIDDKVLNDCLNEITRALLQSNVQLNLVRDMQTNIKKIVNLDDLKRIRNELEYPLEKKISNINSVIKVLELALKVESPDMLNDAGKEGSIPIKSYRGDASGCSYQLLDSAPSSCTIQLGHIQPQAPGHRASTTLEFPCNGFKRVLIHVSHVSNDMGHPRNGDLYGGEYFADITHGFGSLTHNENVGGAANVEVKLNRVVAAANRVLSDTLSM